MPSDVTDQKLLRPQNSMTSHPPPKITDSLPCPRCDSTSTKFCYYNNYNLSQPRHFCKACRRYWTQGGTLRNVPVGGGTRKNSKRIRSCSSSAAAPASSSSSSTVTHEPLPISANPALLFPSGNPEIVSVSTTDVNMNENVPGPGNFTAILNNMQAQNFLGLGGFSGYSMGSDFEELELGFGGPRGWEIPGADYAGVNGTSSVSGVGVAPAGDAASSGCNTWQMVSSEEGGNDGLVNEDCFVWSGLAISTPGQGLK